MVVLFFIVEYFMQVLIYWNIFGCVCTPYAGIKLARNGKTYPLLKASVHLHPKKVIVSRTISDIMDSTTK